MTRVMTTAEADDSPWSLSAVAARAHRTMADRLLRQMNDAGFPGATLSMVELLPLLDPGGRPIVLAGRVAVTRQAIGQILRDLEAEGIAVIEPDGRDSRATVARIAEAGRAVRHAAVAAHGGLRAAVTGLLGPARTRALEADLAILCHAL